MQWKCLYLASTSMPNPFCQCAIHSGKVLYCLFTVNSSLTLASPFGVGCIFGFTSVLGGASTLIVERSYLSRNIRFHFWNCVGLFGTGVLMILFCNYPLVECHLRSDIECYADINQWSQAFRYSYWSCFLGRGVCGLLIIILSGKTHAIEQINDDLFSVWWHLRYQGTRSM